MFALYFLPPGSPMQKCICKHFAGKMYAEHFVYKMFRQEGALSFCLQNTRFYWCKNGFAYILLNIFAVQKCSTKCLQIHFCIKSVVRTFCEAFLQHNCAKRHALQKVLLCKNKVEHFAYTGAICLRIFFYFYPFSFKEAAFEIASSTLPTR